MDHPSPVVTATIGEHFHSASNKARRSRKTTTSSAASASSGEGTTGTSVDGHTVASSGSGGGESTTNKHRSTRRRFTNEGATGVSVTSTTTRESHRSADSTTGPAEGGNSTSKKPSSSRSHKGSTSSSSERERDRERKHSSMRRKKTTSSNTGSSSTPATTNASLPTRRPSPSRDKTDDSSDDDDGPGGALSGDDRSEKSGGAASVGETGAGFAAAFGDAGGADWGAFPTTKTTTTTTTTDNAFGAFDSAFSSDFGSMEPSNFDSSVPTAFDSARFPTAVNDSYDPPSFSAGFPPLAPPKKIYEKAPLEHVPQLPSTDNPILLPPRQLLASKCVPSPVANPLNGNWIVVRTNPQGEHFLAEVDPSRQGVQVCSVAILSVDLQRKIATKYGVSVSAVDTVLTCAVGIHKSHGEARPRVAALLDLLVLDNNEVLRVIAIWQWGYGTSSHPVALQTVLSPPSGSDFIYNTESLLVSDSCVFVSGASPKGPCVFLCKPTVRDTWSANFVGKEAARIACMSVTLCAPQRPYPYLAIALTDGSLSVWTYDAAMTVNSKSTEAFRRLLYPLCRLESTKILLDTKLCPISKFSTMQSMGGTFFWGGFQAKLMVHFIVGSEDIISSVFIFVAFISSDFISVAVRCSQPSWILHTPTMDNTQTFRFEFVILGSRLSRRSVFVSCRHAGLA